MKIITMINITMEMIMRKISKGVIWRKKRRMRRSNRRIILEIIICGTAQ